MSPARAGRRSPAAFIRCSTRCRPRPAEAELLALIAKLNADPDDPRRAGAIAAARRPVAGARASKRSRRTRTSTACIRSMSGSLATGAFERAIIPCTPAGAMVADRQGVRGARPQARRARGGRRRPLQYRRQADGATAARAQLHGDDRPFAHARSACGRAPRRRAGRGGRPAGDGARRLDQAGRDRHRRRHQSRRRARRRARARRGSSATSPMPKPPRAPARSRRFPAASAG